MLKEKEITPRPASKHGHYFMTTSGPINIPVNSFVGVEFLNPTGSNKQIFIARIIDGAFPNSSFTLIRNGTFADGTPLPMYNANFGSPNSPAATVKTVTQLSDPFAGADPFSTVLQSSGSIVIDHDGRIILPPGSSLGILIKNNTLQPNLVAITVEWWEEIL